MMRRDSTFSIADLASKLNVSGRTVERGRAELRREGYIHGKGGSLWVARNPQAALRELNSRRILELLKADPDLTRGELAKRLDISPGRTTDCVKILKSRGDLPENYKFKKRASYEALSRKMDARRAKRKPIIINGVSRNLFNYEMAYLARCNPQTIAKDIKAWIRLEDPDILEALKKRAKIREKLRKPKGVSYVKIYDLVNKALLEDIGLTLEQVNAENIEWITNAGPDDSLLRMRGPSRALS